MGDRPHVRTTPADRVLTVTLDRPDRLNAFTAGWPTS
jgi:enoyl-CoA hydratase/carnithine racemase